VAAEHDDESESGRLYGSASVQHYRGMLGARDCWGVWGHHARSVRGELIGNFENKLTPLPISHLAGIKVYHKRQGTITDHGLLIIDATPLADTHTGCAGENVVAGHNNWSGRGGSSGDTHEDVQTG